MEGEGVGWQFFCGGCWCRFWGKTAVVREKGDLVLMNDSNKKHWRLGDSIFLR